MEDQRKIGNVTFRINDWNDLIPKIREARKFKIDFEGCRGGNVELQEILFRVEKFFLELNFAETKSSIVEWMMWRNEKKL